MRKYMILLKNLVIWWRKKVEPRSSTCLCADQYHRDFSRSDPFRRNGVCGKPAFRWLETQTGNETVRCDFCMGTDREGLLLVPR